MGVNILTAGGVETSAHLQYYPVNIAPAATQLSAIMTENGAVAPTAPAAAVSGGQKAIKRGTLLIVLSGHQSSALVASPSVLMKAATETATTTERTNAETSIAADPI